MAGVQQEPEQSPIADLLAFRGRVPTFSDALLILEACRQGSLTMVNRRLTDLERREIVCGDVFVFDEAVSGIKRWADGRLWSSSRMRDCFLIYIELGMAAGISGFNPRRVPASSPSELLRKKVLSITTSTGQRLRLVAYSSALDDDSDEPAPEANIRGITPRRDPRLANIVIPAGVFHSNTGPMGGAKGDAVKSEHNIAGAAEPVPSGGSSATVTMAGRPKRQTSLVAAAAGRSCSVAAPVWKADHIHCHTRSVGGGFNHDAACYSASHPGLSSSDSPAASTMSAPAPERHVSASIGMPDHLNQHSRTGEGAKSATSTGGRGSARALTSVDSGTSGYRVAAQSYATGAYDGASGGYHYPSQHSYHHPYYAAAAVGHALHQHTSTYYDAYDPYSRQELVLPSQHHMTAAVANAERGEATVPTTSTTPVSRPMDPLAPLSTPAPPTPASTTNPYAAGNAYHGPYPSYPLMASHHYQHYYGRYSRAIRPRHHSHHHYPMANYFGEYGPSPPGQMHMSPAPQPGVAPDLSSVINGGPQAPPASATGPRLLTQSTASPRTTGHALEGDECAKNMARVHRADSGMYLAGGAGTGAHQAREHRDRPGAWTPYYSPAGFARVNTDGGVAKDNGLGEASRLDVSTTNRSPRGASRSGTREDSHGRSPRDRVLAAGEVSATAGVV